MAVFPVFYALIENNLRRVLSYSLNIQLGFMVVAVGIGSELAINGAAAHAASHILYKSLLFMTMGAVLHRLGTVDATNLGGLYRSMPWTAAFCIVGAASIAAVPLFCGFISKAMILTAAMNGGYQLTWIVLLAASAAVLHYCSIKIPYFTFYGPDSGKCCEEAPGNMLVAMAIAAALCIIVGLFPGLLYRHLPFATSYEPYTIEHVVTQAQLLAFSALSLLVLTKYGLYPLHGRGINLDIDWLYRRLGHDLLSDLDHVRSAAWAGFTASVAGLAASATRTVRRYHAPDGVMGRSWPTGTMALWTTILLAAYLILSYV
jgi:multicomponent Na+:H+ antiporter subunit D